MIHANIHLKHLIFKFSNGACKKCIYIYTQAKLKGRPGSRSEERREKKEVLCLCSHTKWFKSMIYDRYCTNRKQQSVLATRDGWPRTLEMGHSHSASVREHGRVHWKNTLCLLIKHSGWNGTTTTNNNNKKQTKIKSMVQYKLANGDRHRKDISLYHAIQIRR